MVVVKISRRQLRKLIEESFVVDPEGTVYTPQTKKVHSEYGEIMGDGSIDEMDVPAVYGEDRTKQATPKLYGVITRNWHKIHSFHKKGPSIYEALLKPDTSEATKAQFLYLLNTYDIITDKEMEQINLEIDLLVSPDFQVFRDQAAERLKKKHHAEIFADIMKEKDLANNPHYVGYAKKQIDKAIAAGYEYYKDAVQLQFFYDMYDLKEKAFKPSYIGYDPDEGVEPEIFAANNGGRIQDRVENHYSVTDKVHSSTLYNDDLYEYSVEKSTEFTVAIIDDLVDAGILEKNKDGRVKMSERSYQIELNNRRGRKEDFYKERGAQSAFLDDPYKPNPNLPVVTEEMIRQIIREGLFVGDTDGTVLSPKDVDDFEYSGTAKDDMSRGHHPKLDALRKSDPKQARSLAVSLGLQDDLTPYEELAVDHIDPKDIHSPDTPVEHPNIIRDPKAHRIQAVITKDFKNYLTSPEAERYAKQLFRSISRGYASMTYVAEIEWDILSHRYRLIENPKWFNLKARIFNKLGYGSDSMLVQLSSEDRAMYRVLYNHLMDKLNKISTNTFNEEYMKVIGGHVEGESFPLTLTEAEIRQIIRETMITPSGGIIQDILEDDAVDARIKNILRTGKEDAINQALNLLSMLYPDKYGTIDTDIEGYTATSDYEREFSHNRAAHMEQAYFANPHASALGFVNWLSGEISNPSSATLNDFKAAIAIWFQRDLELQKKFQIAPVRTDDKNFIDNFPPFPLIGFLVNNYLGLDPLYASGINPGPPLKNAEAFLDHLMSSARQHVDIRPGLQLAIDTLKSEGLIIPAAREGESDQFIDPDGWLQKNGYGY